jgi:hypothetical protein
MARYLITSPHTKEECLRALDEELVKGIDILGKFDYGCMAGDHTGYAIVDVNSKNDALNFVPTFLQSKARIVEIGKVTPEMIKSFHTKAA